MSKISFLVAGVLLLLHTMMPHHHTSFHETAHIEEAQSAYDLFDIIAIAFYLDQGEGHLEDYQSSESNFSLILSSLCEIEASYLPLPVIQNCFPSFTTGIDSHAWNPSELRFRGPPLHA